MRNGDNFIECTGNKIRRELFIENLHKNVLTWSFT